MADEYKLPMHSVQAIQLIARDRAQAKSNFESQMNSLAQAEEIVVLRAALELELTKTMLDQFDLAVSNEGAMVFRRKLSLVIPMEKEA
jgi:hypothetical protein